ncbi:uncharacterized protein LOC143034708 [Oratosquilla oratoria]|uniref:uncharacterized protein LOC143034708 n=1 Tax=Oratosquilla oratoria TaxID=337810 RepID=UPI003F7623F5
MSPDKAKCEIAPYSVIIVQYLSRTEASHPCNSTPQVFLLLAGVACAAPSLYTPEVAAARAEFEAAYAAAALAAEQNALPEVVAVEPAPLVAPEPVTDTEEVALAKKEFAAAYEAALAALAANALPEVVHPEGAPVPVEDTAEVTDAKAKFAIAFKAAADAAEAAGDIDLDGSLSRFSGFISPLLTNTYPFGAYGVHAPVAYSAGKVVHAASPLTPINQDMEDADGRLLDWIENILDTRIRLIYNFGLPIKTLEEVILFLVGAAAAAPMASPDIYTPEVAAARANHEAAYAGSCSPCSQRCPSRSFLP